MRHKKKANIKYYNLITPSGIHAEFDTALLKVIMLAVEDYDKVVFYAESEHCEICKKKLPTNITLHPLKMVHKNLFEGKKALLLDFLGCFYLIKAFITSKKQDLLFFASTHPFSKFLIYCLNKIFNHDVYVCIHGEVEIFAKGSCYQGSTANKKYQAITKFTLKRISNIKYIILGVSIFNNVKHIFNAQSNVIVIDHPYDFNAINKINTNFYPLVIGQIGLGDVSKGTNYIFELASLLKEEIVNNKLKIKIIGQLSKKLLHLDNKLVEYKLKSLDMNKFEGEIRGLHYTLQLRNCFLGKATASGSFFDTIKYEKPYLSLTNEYINNYAQKYKNTGYVFETIEQMAQYIKKIIATHTEHHLRYYKESVEAIRSMQKDLSLQTIAVRLREQMNVFNEKYKQKNNY
jgi:glycosyltransferase involved in cell wall biosynthesis